MSIKTAFNKGAKDYDAPRKQLIPCFDDFYGTALQLIDRDMDSKISVLDLGAGTGLFSYLVSQILPNAEFTLYDLSENMLSEARTRFSNLDLNLRYFVKNYSSEPISGKYDLIISALSIHHLVDFEKKNLFQKIFDSLRTNERRQNVYFGESTELHERSRVFKRKQLV